MNKQETIDQALKYFDEGFACSQSVLLSFAPRFEIDTKSAAMLSSTFGGGMGRLREKCGAVTGGFMVIGLACGTDRGDNMDERLKAYEKVQELNAAVNKSCGSTICKELLEQHATQSEVEARKHHQKVCRNVIKEAVANLYDILEKK